MGALARGLIVAALALAPTLGWARAVATAHGVVAFRVRGREVVRPVLEVSSNRFRSEYKELHIQGGGLWLFRDDVHSGRRRTENEITYYRTSRDLGLDVVPRLSEASWNGRRGSLQRVVSGAQRSMGGLAADASLVRASTVDGRPQVDWDSLHAVAVLHHVTRMHDDAPYNFLISRARDGRLRYDAIDGEWIFGRNVDGQRQFPQHRLARQLILQGIQLGGPSELSARLRARLQKVDVARWRRHLEATGVGAGEIEAAIGRLRNVQERGLAAILDA